MAVDAVGGELVSAMNSLVSGNFEGNAGFELRAEPRVTPKNLEVSRKEDVPGRDFKLDKSGKSFAVSAMVCHPKCASYSIGTNKHADQAECGRSCSGLQWHESA
jgi:hypothetical protein